MGYAPVSVLFLQEQQRVIALEQLCVCMVRGRQTVTVDFVVSVRTGLIGATTTIMLGNLCTIMQPILEDEELLDLWTQILTMMAEDESRQIGKTYFQASCWPPQLNLALFAVR
jgi:hypothetical protein